MYLHSNKETNYDQADALGLSEEAQDEFRSALYEVEFDMEITEDGKYTIVEIRDGKDRFVPA